MLLTWGVLDQATGTLHRPHAVEGMPADPLVAAEHMLTVEALRAAVTLTVVCRTDARKARALQAGRSDQRDLRRPARRPQRALRIFKADFIAEASCAECCRQIRIHVGQWRRSEIGGV
jgi:hypothetical protein